MPGGGNSYALSVQAMCFIYARKAPGGKKVSILSLASKQRLNAALRKNDSRKPPPKKRGVREREPRIQSLFAHRRIRCKLQTSRGRRCDHFVIRSRSNDPLSASAPAMGRREGN